MKELYKSYNEKLCLFLIIFPTYQNRKLLSGKFNMQYNQNPALLWKDTYIWVRNIIDVQNKALKSVGSIKVQMHGRAAQLFDI
jgi:hypothetical protein